MTGLTQRASVLFVLGVLPLVACEQGPSPLAPPPLDPSYYYASVNATFAGDEGVEAYEFDTEDASICPAKFSQGPAQMPFWMDIQNVGLKKFWAPAPFFRDSIVSNDRAYYSMSGVAESDPSGWLGEGLVLMRCRRVAGIGGWHYFGAIQGVHPNQFTVWKVMDCPEGMEDLGDSCMESGPSSGGGEGGGDECTDGMYCEPCTWYTYILWVYWNGQWVPIDSWEQCEYN